MPNVNNFKAFSAAAGANVLTQAQYEALADLLTGFVAGTASSASINKTLRQSSIMAAVLGALINDVMAQDAIDDGTTATLLSNLFASIISAGYAQDTGAVNAYVVNHTPPILFLRSGTKISFTTANASTVSNPTINVDGLGPVPITQFNGSVLTPGQIPANSLVTLMYNAAVPRFELQQGGLPLATLQTLFAALGGSGAQTFAAANATPGTQQVVPIIQADARFAALAGLATQVFSVANASLANHAVPLGQADARYLIGLGMGQTLQNLTASRALNTVYTNSTGKPIGVWVWGTHSTAGAASLQANMTDGVTVSTIQESRSPDDSASKVLGIFFIVPPNIQYSVGLYAGGSFVAGWAEYR